EQRGLHASSSCKADAAPARPRRWCEQVTRRAPHGDAPAPGSARTDGEPQLARGRRPRRVHGAARSRPGRRRAVLRRGRPFARDRRMDVGQLDLRPEGGLERARRDAARWIEARPLAERALLAAAIGAVWVAGYHVIGWSTDPARALALDTALDRAIPFVPETVYLYGLVYPASLYPLFVIRSRALLRRAALAYVLVIVASLLCFVLLPVTCAGF